MPQKVVWKTETGNTTPRPPGQTGPNRFANTHACIVPGASTSEQVAQNGGEIRAAGMKNTTIQEERTLYGLETTRVKTLVVTNDADLLDMVGISSGSVRRPPAIPSISRRRCGVWS
jgi:hypothetical protein